MSALERSQCEAQRHLKTRREPCRDSFARFPEATLSLQSKPSSQFWEYTPGGLCELGFVGKKEGYSGVTVAWLVINEFVSMRCRRAVD
jgi:hypothetical protein